MKKLIDRLLSAIADGGAAVVCTILESVGSCPRGGGTHMIVFSDGTICGTVGGGEVEHLSSLEGRQLLPGGAALCRVFSISPDGYYTPGMTCAGRVTVFYQRFTPECLPLLQQIATALHGYENIWLQAIRQVDGSIHFSLVNDATAAQAPERFSSRANYFPGELSIYTEPLVRAGRVYLFGGGHVGQALVPVLSQLDFRVTVYDSRPELANIAHFPDAEQIILGDYDDIFSTVTLTERDYVILMTPEHDSDFLLLSQVLTKKVSYVGCIGSRHKIAKTRARLLSFGFSETVIDAVHSPIGLPISAQTPEELAISIAAELIQHRALHR